ncbi:hypothetical protein EOL96_01005 [Candidatus Saccharibacteria bacterium]|nr:hypothetical protein [Candidatus Saccharibacteria bacterium]
MSEDESQIEATIMTKWAQHRFIGLIIIVISISLFLVSVSLSLYNSSGAAQLDLSRPGYQDVREQARRETVTKAFPSTGVLDEEAMSDFSVMYQEQISKVLSSESFDAAALSEESLQLMTANRAQYDVLEP